MRCGQKVLSYIVLTRLRNNFTKTLRELSRGQHHSVKLTTSKGRLEWRLWIIIDRVRSLRSHIPLSCPLIGTTPHHQGVIYHIRYLHFSNVSHEWQMPSIIRTTSLSWSQIKEGMETPEEFESPTCWLQGSSRALNLLKSWPRQLSSCFW